MMRALDDRERLIALLGAGVGAALAVAMLVVGIVQGDAGAGAARAGIAVVMAGFLALMARRRSRPWTGAALFLLAFGPWGALVLAGAPFLGAGMWIWFRGRPSPEEIEERRRARDAKIAERRAARAGGRTSGSAASSASDSTERRTPEASKRYTPPRSKTRSKSRR